MGNNKLSLEGQIQQMKAQNIGFNIVKEPEAIEYLSNHTYYFRLKYYAENYEKTRLPGVGTQNPQSPNEPWRQSPSWAWLESQL